MASFPVVAAGSAVATWAMAENRFFSAVVRIQKDRGRGIVSSGPYQFVRHPANAGDVLAGVAVPLALGSVWALVPGLAMVAVTTLRTTLEDRTLQEEFDGYRVRRALPPAARRAVAGMPVQPENVFPRSTG